MSTIHTITRYNTMPELIGKQVRILAVSEQHQYGIKHIGKEGEYLGHAGVKIDGETVEFYWGLQLEEVGNDVV